MENFEFSDELCRFIQRNIPTVDAAELILLYHAFPASVFAAEEAVAKLGPGIKIDDTLKYLRLFEADGILGREGPGYRYRSESSLAPQVDLLGLAYAQRPVTLIRIIYAFRDSSIKSFADAFKLRK